MTTTTRPLTAREMDTVLASFIRDARRAIRKSEGGAWQIGLADFNENLARRNYSEKIAYCKFWIRMARVQDDE